MNGTDNWKTLPQIAADAPDGYGTRTLNRLANDPDSSFPAPEFKDYYDACKVKDWVAGDNERLLKYLGVKYGSL